MVSPFFACVVEVHGRRFPVSAARLVFWAGG